MNFDKEYNSHVIDKGYFLRYLEKKRPIAIWKWAKDRNRPFTEK